MLFRRFAFAAALALLPSIPALAQNDFKDPVPPDHWAYQAVTNLQKSGILIGYPDGYFRGKRTITRYEMATALERALKRIGAIVGPAGPQGPVGPQGAQGVMGDRGVAGEQGPPGVTPEEVVTLRKLTDEFKNTLTGMGNNIGQINRRLDGIGSDVAALKRRLDDMPTITGFAFLGARMNGGTGPAVDQDGRLIGVGPDVKYSQPAFLHLFDLNVAKNLPGGGTFNGNLLFTNYNTYLGGNVGVVGPFNNTPPGNVIVGNLQISTPLGAVGRNSSLDFGRIGVSSMNPFIFSRALTDSYFNPPLGIGGLRSADWEAPRHYQMLGSDRQYQWDFAIDGARVNSHFGSLNFTGFAGQIASAQGINGGPFAQPIAGMGVLPGNNPLPLFIGGNLPTGMPFQGQGLVDQVAGVEVGSNLGFFGHHSYIGATVLDARADGPGFSSVLVPGAMFNTNFGSHLNFDANWAKSITQTGHFTTVNPYQNNAFNANVGYGSGSLSVNAGYRYVDPLFYAPGYWGRIGNWINPTNIQGPTFRASYNVCPMLGVNLGGDFFSAARNRGAAGGLTTNDDIQRILVGLRYDVSKNFRTTVDWEGVYWSLDNGGGAKVHPTQHYITFGTGYHLTPNTLMGLNYQIGDFNGHNAVGELGIGHFNYHAFTAQVNGRF